jgi:3-phosphoshikimate 1-carboxyvinyltransferase
MSMNFKLKFVQGEVSASISLPASKSISNRILIMNALGSEHAAIGNLSGSDDTKTLIRALLSSDRHFNIGAAGTAMRFLTAYLALKPGEWTLTGSERMKRRPIRLLVEALNSLGADIEYKEKKGFPPLKISGRELEGGEASISGGISSQYISALLMAAPIMRRGLRLKLEGEVISRPYIRLTTELMRMFGVQSVYEDGGRAISVEPQRYTPAPFVVEADWSAASYWYSIAALAPDLEIKLIGLMPDSLQGDAAVAGLFDRLGVGTRFVDGGIVIGRSGRPVCERLDYNFSDEPDLAQTLVTACCFLGIHFRFTGLQSLRIKETDRISALQSELRKLGYAVRVEGSALSWGGDKCAPDPLPVIETYDDHRMAMCFAPAAIIREEGVEIANPEVVSKSYPDFWDDIRRAGIVF